MQQKIYVMMLAY